MRPSRNPFSWQNWFYAFNHLLHLLYSLLGLKHSQYHILSAIQQIGYLLENSHCHYPSTVHEFAKWLWLKMKWKEKSIKLPECLGRGNPGSLLCLRSLGQCLLLSGNPMGCQAPENGGLGFFCSKLFQLCSEQGLEFHGFIFCVKTHGYVCFVSQFN